jgi:hypothetical protein
MKYFFLSAILISALGAGCMPAPGSRTPSATADTDSFVETTAPITTATCPTSLTEDETGAASVPVLDSYAKLPHLGQFYTALDCNHPEWVEKIHGMKDGSYTLGVHLFVTNGQMTQERRDLLTSLGFTENQNGTWQTAKLLTTDQLLKLKPFLLEVDAPLGTQLEDCVLCG